MFYYALNGAVPLHRKVCKIMQSDTGCSGCHAGGILPGTMVESDRGSIDITQVKSGDYLATFEHGMQPVADIAASNVWTSDAICPKYFWPFYVPEMILGNTDPIIIMPEHQVLLNSDILKKETGNAYALVPITTLDGFCGIHKIVPEKQISSYKVQFAKNELLILNGGAVVNCMVETDFLSEKTQPSHSFPFLGTEETKTLITTIGNSTIAPSEPDLIMAAC